MSKFILAVAQPLTKRWTIEIEANNFDEAREIARYAFDVQESDFYEDTEGILMVTPVDVENPELEVEGFRKRFDTEE